jgi:hypothetical protein
MNISTSAPGAVTLSNAGVLRQASSGISVCALHAGTSTGAFTMLACRGAYTSAGRTISGGDDA